MIARTPPARPAGVSRRMLLAAGTMGGALAIGGGRTAVAATPLEPFGATPSPRQRVWHARRQYAFVHFGINTFTGREWGYGDEAPALFDPTDFSAAQIVSAVRAGGLHGLVLTAKHHDGFCLWPTMLTGHCIRNSPFRGGRGDVVGEIAAACRAQGLPFGVYLSPWDRNHAEYGRAAYLDYYVAQLEELLTRYGPLFEIWFDGANGGDGFYGGARETRHIDAATYYHWPRIWSLVRRLQPDCVIWGAPGSDARWIGNEQGVAGDPCRPTMPLLPRGGRLPDGMLLERGQADGPVWWPAEVDVSIRPGWFWHPGQDGSVMPVERLIRLSLESVGRGANLILNLAPDRRGRIPDLDASRIADWRRFWDCAERTDAAPGAIATASSSVDAAHAAGCVLEADPERFWCAATTDATLQLSFAAPRGFDLVRLREYLPLGLRIATVRIDACCSGDWRHIGTIDAVGNERLLRLDAPVSATGLRLVFSGQRAPPALARLSLLLLPPSPGAR